MKTKAKYREPGKGFAHQLHLNLDPPPTERGGKSANDQIEVGIDWLSATASNDRLTEVLGIMRSHFPESGDGEAAIPTRSFKSALQFGGGWQVSWNPDYPYFHLLMKGEACTAATAGLMAAILDDLAPIVRFARVDFNVDVLISRAILPQQMTIYEEEGYAVGYKNYVSHRSRKSGKESGYTFSAGSRGSNGGGRHFRAYLKDKRELGEATHVRYEAEYSGERAASAVAFLRGAVGRGAEALQKSVASLALGAIDFREKGHSRNTGRRKRCEFWQTLLDYVDAATVTLARRGKKAARWVRAFTEQYARLLYEFRRTHPKEYLDFQNEVRLYGQRKSEHKQSRDREVRHSFRDWATAA